MEKNPKESFPTTQRGEKTGLEDSSASSSPQKVQQGTSYVAWLAVAVALAGASFFFAKYHDASGKDRESRTAVVPESYAVCTEPGKIYTVDDARPTVDCLLIHKDEIRVAGTFGT